MPQGTQETASNFAILAQDTAGFVGCRALEWWLIPGNPDRLGIKAVHRHISHVPVPIFLEALLPSSSARSLSPSLTTQSTTIGNLSVAPSSLLGDHISTDKDPILL